MNIKLNKFLSYLPFLALVVIMWLPPVIANAQNGDIFITGSVKNDESAKKMGDIKITVKQDGTSFDQIETSGNGKYEFTFPLGHVYDISFQRDGFITKTIRFNTKDIPEEDQAGGFRADLDMSMVEKPDGFDEEVTEEPIGIASFDEQKNAIEFDYAYTAQRQKEINNELERVENMGAEMAAKQAEFDELIADGDDKMADEKFEKAISSFEEALGIFPDNEMANTKLVAAREALEAQKRAENLEEEYNRLLDEGEENKSAGNLEDALDNFEAASELKPGEQLPKDKIAEVEDLIEKREKNAEYDALIAEADEEFDNKKYNAAIEKYNQALKVKPGENYPTNRKKEAERLKSELAEAEQLQEQYESLIASADELYDKEDYEQAIEKYQEASALKSEESYPKNRIAEAEDRIEERKARMADAEAEEARQAKLDEFNQLINEGETFLSNESFEDARSKFQEAAALMPDKNLPQQKLAEVDEAIAARESEMEAEERAARQAELDAQFDELIEQADANFDNGDFEAARQDYQAALEIKPNEKYPSSRLDRIDEKIASKQQSAEEERLAEQRAEEEAARKAEEEKRRREERASERLAEEQRLERLEEKKREQERLAEERRKQEEADKERERDLLSNVDASKEDQVEKFFSEARKSDLEKRDRQVEEDKKRYQQDRAEYSEAAEKSIAQRQEEINLKKEKREEIHREGDRVLEQNRESNRDLKKLNRENIDSYVDISERKRSYNLGEAQRKADNYNALAQNDNLREEQIEKVEEKKQQYREQQNQQREAGEELREKNEEKVAEHRSRLQNMERDGEDQRQEKIAQIDSREEQYREQQQSFAKNANERRQSNYEQLKKKEKESEKITKNTAEEIPNDNWEEIQRVKERQENFKRTKERESELRRQINYSEQHKKKGAEPPSYDDYNLPEGAEDLAEGVTETSYDMMGGKMIVIERKVRIGNKVDVYKKVSSKHSTYYFKNDRSITESTWRQNTLQ